MDTIGRALALVLSLLALAPAHAVVTFAENGEPQAVILTKAKPLGSVALAAQELQQHVKRMTGATLPIDTVGQEARYPRQSFLYVGASSATADAGVEVNRLEPEFYTIRTVGSNLYVAGRDGGDDAWWDLAGCQPGTLFGVYHLLGEILHVRWLWPGESGVSVPTTPKLSVDALDLTTGPAMVQRKFRTPRMGAYTENAPTYGFGVPVLPADPQRKLELAREEALWLRRQRMGARQKPAFGHYFKAWWQQYGATEPALFAVLPAGKKQPSPAADRTKQNVSNPAVWQKRLDEWQAAGAGPTLNLCPTDSRNFCLCPTCLGWDRPAQDPAVVFKSSDARLSDRYAHFYREVATRARAINPAVTVYAYAYDVYRHYPLEETVPSNVALAYIPGAPSAVVPSEIAETEQDVLGWIAKGCTQMYLRPNWMLAGHAGPFWPTHRLGDHLRTLLQSGNIKGFDSDSSTSSYGSFGLYYYLICRLIAEPSLTPDAIIDEYCSAFGPAAPRVREYLGYWENFIYRQSESGHSDLLGWSSCVRAYGDTYDDAAFDGAVKILDAAEALLTPADNAIRARLTFLRLACDHGRLTAHAIALADPARKLSANPEAEKAMRALLSFRNQNAESWVVWREWMIDRESLVPGMKAYWSELLAPPR